MMSLPLLTEIGFDLGNVLACDWGSTQDILRVRVQIFSGKHMIERRCLGEIPPKPHTVYKSKSSEKKLTEYVVTRDGFSGGFSLLYGEEAPTGVSSIKNFAMNTERLTGVYKKSQEIGASQATLARRHVKSWLAPEGKHLLEARTALYQSVSKACRISVLRGNLDSEYCFSNGDHDELFFVYEGVGELHSNFGVLKVRKHDYVLIPRGTSYRFVGFKNAEMFLVEGDPQVEIPGDFRNPHGQLKMEAPYTHRDFRSPERLLSHKEQEAFLYSVVLRDGKLTEMRYKDSPVRVVGWDGSVYPVAFSIHDYLPKTGKIHLPPNMHLTFKSKTFVICSFVPRMVDYGEGAIPCPYPHANVHCDEILYYVSGHFTSRRGIDSRSISYHPIGLPHGPQPGNYFASVGSKTSDELAVMVDVWESLQASDAAVEFEDQNYALSWT